jgi:putative tryptophan/tyrosine transport system substrate-binding protein
MIATLKRREFMSLLGGAAAWPLAARAQQPEQKRRIGVLIPYAENDPEAQPRVTALRRGLAQLGWTEGRNVRLEYRWSASDAASIRRLARELVELQPDVILTESTPVTSAALHETRTIPIVFVQVGDPVGSGFVASFPRPGGNATGFNNIPLTMTGKWLELLLEVVPRTVRVMFLFNPPTAPYAQRFFEPFKAAAASIGVEAVASPVHDAAEIEAAIAAFAREPDGGLIVLPSAFCRPIAMRSSHWRRDTACRPSTRSNITPRVAVSSLTETLFPMRIGKPRPISTAFCAGQSPPIFQCRHRLSSS